MMRCPYDKLINLNYMIDTSIQDENEIYYRYLNLRWKDILDTSIYDGEDSGEKDDGTHKRIGG